MDSKVIFRGKLFTVYNEDIKLPSGKIKTYSLVRRNPTAVIIPQDDKGNIFLIYQYRYLFQKEILEAVAGFIDNGEKPLQAAKRELKEETGITASNWKALATIQLSNSVIYAKSHLFIASKLQKGVSHPEEDEKIRLVKMPIKQAVEKILKGEIRDGSTISGIMMLDKLSNRL